MAQHEPSLPLPSGVSAKGNSPPPTPPEPLHRYTSASVIIDLSPDGSVLQGCVLPNRRHCVRQAEGISPALAMSVCRRSLLNALLTADLLNFYRGSMLRMPTPSASEALGTNERAPLVRAIDGYTLAITDRRTGRRTDLPPLRSICVGLRR
jgi:hypothetical protein